MNSRVVMALLCAGMLWSGCATDQPLRERFPDLLGVYKGKVSTAGESYAVTTILRFNSNEVLQGLYTFEEGTNKSSGILYDFRNVRGQAVECTWNDEYGIGILKMTFSSDLKQFKGRWGAGSKVNRKCSWDGVRMAPEGAATHEERTEKQPPVSSWGNFPYFQHAS